MCITPPESELHFGNHSNSFFRKAARLLLTYKKAAPVIIDMQANIPYAPSKIPEVKIGSLFTKPEGKVLRSFNGKTPRVPESAFISEAAYVIGDVEIGENSGVFPGAVIRGDFAKIKIGCNTMIEDNSVLHTGIPMEIGDNVIVGHSVVVHGRKIGSNNLVGNNATILDNAEIGDYCIIGAGCLISPGMRVPDNSLVIGVPGKIQGEISPKQRERLLGGSQTYLELVKRYKEQGGL